MHIKWFRYILVSVSLLVALSIAALTFVFGTPEHSALTNTPLLLEGALSIEAGGSHTCALLSTGGVKCWGYNNSGQIGDNTSGNYNNRPTPVEVSGLTSGVAQITAGAAHTCALLSTGGVKCWGDNNYGQIGDNSFSNDRLTPVEVSGFTIGVAQITAGANHTCALLSSGGVKCWGANWAGQIGDNTDHYYSSPTPVEVSGLAIDVTQITAGARHTCALLSTGGVKCWGDNYYGQLGDNTSGTNNNRLTPVEVAGLTSGVTQITAGDNHTCALLSTGGVKCWGYNNSGQIGDNTSGNENNRHTPVEVSGLTRDVAQITAGANHTCALLSSGGVKCWGANWAGQIGDNTDHYYSSPTPVEVSGLAIDVTQITAGARHTCALLSTGGVKCWGDNYYGQLGDNTSGTNKNRLSPVEVAGLTSGVTQITAGGYHTCALLNTGGVKCWGDNEHGQIGDNISGTNRFTPVDVSGLTIGVAQITAGGSHTCALLSTGGVKCWGGQTRTPMEVSGLTSGVAQITAGGSHTCALLSTGGVKCWGDNEHGQIGDNISGTNRFTPVDISGLTIGAAQITAGGYHTCALLSTGGVKCWGHYESGQIGVNTSFDRLIPVDVSGLASDVAQITAGASHTCALLKTGGIKCWGYNTSGQLGDNTNSNRLTPVNVSGLASGVAQITAGANHTCALLSSGGVKCWGENISGQIGDNAAGSKKNRLAPVNVSGLTSGVAQITAGTAHTCALLSTGGVKCWGHNKHGQIGDNTHSNRRTPVSVSGLAIGVTQITAGAEHTCALLSTGGVKCWGGNNFGQLGDNMDYYDSRLAPVNVSGLAIGVTQITAGGYHTCALLSTGGVKCWGYNKSGQIGDNTNSERRTPVSVSGLTSDVTQITVGVDHTCALLSTGGVKCWGSNSSGQLGDNTNYDYFHPTPADVSCG